VFPVQKNSFAKRIYILHNSGHHRELQCLSTVNYRLVAAFCEMKFSSSNSTDLRRVLPVTKFREAPYFRGVCFGKLGYKYIYIYIYIYILLLQALVLAATSTTGSTSAGAALYWY
jgi:hypothetical protein